MKLLIIDYGLKKKSDIYCSGITYNLNNKKCVGTKEGFLRKDDNNFIAYIKPKNLENIDKDNIVGFSG